MRTAIIPLVSLFLLSACTSSEDRETRMVFEGIISAIELYEEEYGKPIEVQNSIELADVLQRKNEKKIIFYDSWGIRNKAGEIIDGYGNVILVRNEGGSITLYSKGRNGVADSIPDNDDIIMHYESKAQPAGAINSEAAASPR